ncbi:MAG: AmmeMemoRadiSam system protein B [Deltaproteobacteria bacterium]|nr:AmmeMemoRadiSam system protein B [Deltaproteobacteria bacterium]
MNGNIKKSIIAGSWYPGHPRVLKADIHDFFDKAPDRNIKGEIVGLVAPHAGYVYSGQVAAYAYKCLMGKNFDAVIVIGPSHRALFDGVSAYDQGGYETPLGIVYVDTDLTHEMMNAGSVISVLPAVHTQEHSIEIQLPFLQVILSDFCFVPLMMGDQNSRTCVRLAEAIFRAIQDKKCLIVASSDLSHFHDYQEAVKMDAGILRHLENMDDEGLLRNLARRNVEACGGGPMAVAMMVAKKLGADKVEVMPYANSGDITGDRDSVVGYASAVFYR